MYVQSIMDKSSALFSQVSRFCKNYKITKLMNRMCNTYVYPIINYCSEIWYSERATIDLVVEKFNKIATRITLSIPPDHRHEDYIPYQQRLDMLHEISYQDRLNIKSITTLLKIVHSTTYYHDRNLINGLVNRNRNRLHTVFNIHSDIPSLNFAIRKSTAFRHIINLQDDPTLNKTRMKQAVLLNGT